MKYISKNLLELFLFLLMGWLEIYGLICAFQTNLSTGIIAVFVPPVAWVFALINTPKLLI